ncbi:unnamed protein product, partial [Cuscuta europaea]
MLNPQGSLTPKTFLGGYKSRCLNRSNGGTSYICAYQRFNPTCRDCKLNTTVAGVIPPTPVQHPISTTTPSASSGKGKEKMIADQTNAEQARKRHRVNDGSQIIPIDHVVDLTGPDAERKRHVLPLQPKNPVFTNMPFDDWMFVEFS